MEKRLIPFMPMDTAGTAISCIFFSLIECKCLEFESVKYEDNNLPRSRKISVNPESRVFSGILNVK